MEAVIVLLATTQAVTAQRPWVRPAAVGCSTVRRAQFCSLSSAPPADTAAQLEAVAAAPCSALSTRVPMLRTRWEGLQAGYELRSLPIWLRPLLP